MTVVEACAMLAAVAVILDSLGVYSGAADRHTKQKMRGHYQERQG